MISKLAIWFKNLKKNAQFFDGIRYGILSILLILITFPDFDPNYSTGVDGPLPWVFNYFFSENLNLGKDVIFPHGPLAFILYPLPMGNNLLIAIIFYSIIKLFLSCSIIHLFRIKDPTNWLTPFLILLISLLPH